MGKAKNAIGTGKVTLSLSEQSVRVLQELVPRGIYGKNEAEIAGRIVDKELERFVKPPLFTLPLRKANKRSEKASDRSEPSVSRAKKR